MNFECLINLLDLDDSSSLVFISGIFFTLPLKSFMLSILSLFQRALVLTQILFSFFGFFPFGTGYSFSDKIKEVLGFRFAEREVEMRFEIKKKK